MILRDDQIVCRCKSGTSTHRRRAHHSKMPLAMWRTSLTTRNDGPWWARYRQTFWQPVGALPGQISDYHRIIVNYHHHGTQPFLVPIASLTRLNWLDLGWSQYRAMKLPHPWPYCYKRTTTESLGISGWSTFWLRRHPNIIQPPEVFFFRTPGCWCRTLSASWSSRCLWLKRPWAARSSVWRSGRRRRGSTPSAWRFWGVRPRTESLELEVSTTGALRQRVLMGNMMNRCEFWGIPHFQTIRVWPVWLKTYLKFTFRSISIHFGCG